MKKYSALTILSLSINIARGQLQISGPDSIFVANPDTRSSIKLLRLERTPCFPGGIDKLNAYLKNNLVYPNKAFKNHIEGTVYVSFTVDIDGSLIDVKTDSNLSIDIVAEALRLVKSFPKWVPATASGTPVRCGYLLPVVFKTNNHL